MNRRTWWLLAGSIALLAVAASVTGLHNQFAYDDVYIVEKNLRVHSLAHWWHLFDDTYWAKNQGGDGYRPLTMLGFAVQWVAGHGSPLIFHVVNTVLYVAMSVAVYWLASAVLPYAPAWIAAALFAVHPVHVEAVANVVGQSELAVGLLLTLAMALYLHGRALGALSVARQVGIVACFAIGLLFKEHAIVLPALVVAAEVIMVRDKNSVWRRLMVQRPFLLVLTLVAVCYLWARGLVLSGGLAGFQPFVVFQGLHLSTQDRVLTMIGVAPDWTRLFLWPARLTTEYTPPYVDIAQGVSFTQLPGLLLMLGVIGLAFALWRRKPAASFGLWWMMIAIAPVSNLLIPAGFIIAERTLLFPSVGVMLALGALIPPVYEWLAVRRLQLAGVAIVVLLLLAGGWRSATRAPAWHDDDALFKSAVRETPDSYRAHYMLGAWYMQNKRMRDGEKELREAMHLFPFDPFMAYSFAEQYRGAGMCKPAINLYRWSIAVDTAIKLGRRELALCLLLDLRLDSAKIAAVDAVRHGTKVAPVHEIILKADSAKRNMARRSGALDSSGYLRPSLQHTQKKAPSHSVP